MKYSLLALLYSLSLMADDFNPRTDVIADNYEAGSYLIYDCFEKHWTCVQEPFYTECKEKRAGSILNTDEDLLSCAPIGKFPTKQSCYQRILFLTTHNHGNRFCLREDLKTKAIEIK